MCHRVGSVAGMTTTEAQESKNRRAPPSAPSHLRIPSEHVEKVAASTFRALRGAMASTASSPPRRLPLARAADEFVLTTVLLFLAVTGVRWLRDPGSTLCIADLDVALAVIGVLTGTIVTALIFTPPGRRSGGHMNPAVTVALWRMDVFPGRSVLPYVLAQLAGSAAGTALGRLAWGRAVSFTSGRLRRDHTRAHLAARGRLSRRDGQHVRPDPHRRVHPGPSQPCTPAAVRHRTVGRAGDRCPRSPQRRLDQPRPAVRSCRVLRADHRSVDLSGRADPGSGSRGLGPPPAHPGGPTRPDRITVQGSGSDAIAAPGHR